MKNVVYSLSCIDPRVVCSSWNAPRDQKGRKGTVGWECLRKPLREGE